MKPKMKQRYSIYVLTFSAAILSADFAYAQPVDVTAAVLMAPAGGNTMESRITADLREAHIPDPKNYRKNAQKNILKAHNEGDPLRTHYLNRTIELINSTRRPNQLELSLEDALHRTLENSYAIQFQRYNPAIDTTRVVEAEAVFDAVFFTNMTKNNVDRPSGSQLTATDLDFFTVSTGIRKLLPTGTQVSARYQMNRTKTTLSFQQINPEYTTNLIRELRQNLYAHRDIPEFAQNPLAVLR